MTGTGLVADELRALFEAKARAELERADALLAGSDSVRWSGDPQGRVFVVKGAPDPEDTAAGSAFAGPDGGAVRKALAALGLPDDAIFYAVARPERGAPDEAVRARLALQIEAVDPAIVLAADPAAATDLAGAVHAHALDPGRLVVSAGRRLLALDGLRASLSDESLKRRVWSQMKALATED
ncbi:MAG: hypothetical protein C0418_01210 [Coriobacteriaceae bacterium]|nr:hypothetical protein [Coriobacteriaceae bacterium]